MDTTPGEVPSGDYEQIYKGNANEFDVTNLRPASTYHFLVKAVSSAGHGQYSRLASFETEAGYGKKSKTKKKSKKKKAKKPAGSEQVLFYIFFHLFQLYYFMLFVFFISFLMFLLIYIQEERWGANHGRWSLWRGSGGRGRARYSTSTRKDFA